MSRRDTIRMTDEELTAYIDGAQTIILNTIGPDGVPHPMPMWFALDDDGTILMTTFTKSQKILNIERDPRVSLLIESGTVYSDLRGVVIYAEAELVRELEAVKDILAHVGIRNSNGDDENADAIRAGVSVTAPKRTGIRIRPERVMSWNHDKLGGIY